MLASGSRVALHTLTVRPDDDDPDLIVAGRAETGEFVELPAICGDAIGLLVDGLSIEEVEERLIADHDVELDVAELVEALAGLSFVRSIGDEHLPDPAADAPPSHFPRLAQRHVAWLFGRTSKAAWVLVVGAALFTLMLDPALIPHYTDFFWTDYVGLAVLVNTAMLVAAISIHEMMHLLAARSLGAPARIGFGTRLHNLVVQTDVTAVWGVPRRSRYRVYVAGLAWDFLLMAMATLVLAYAQPPGLARGLLQALILTVLLNLPFQIQVYMRTDLYYVLRDLLRARNLFDDGLAYANHLRAKIIARIRNHPGPDADPTAHLPLHQRRATRVYTVFLVGGATVALSVAIVFGLPIAVVATVTAIRAVVAGITGGPLLPAVDSGVLILIEGGLQALFIVTFIRTHRHWFEKIRQRKR